MLDETFGSSEFSYYIHSIIHGWNRLFISTMDFLVAASDVIDFEIN